MAYNNYGQTGWMPQQPNYNNYQMQPMQQSYAPMASQLPLVPQKPVFVDGEMAARVFQMPDNWPAGIPLYLWDLKGDYFYIKMVGQNGVPMPIQTFEYHAKAPEPSGYISGDNRQVDTAQFVTHEDLDRRFNELKNMMQNNQSSRSQNGSSNQQNRGG